MIAVTRFPSPRTPSRFSRFARAVRRAWLQHQIIGCRMAIQTGERLIANDLLVLHLHPDLRNKIVPEIDARHLDMQVDIRRLTQLQIRMMDFNQ